MEARACGVESPTGAMKDTHERHRGSMGKYNEAFQLVEGQTGCLVFLRGEAAGCELLSRPEKYAMLHQKIIGSYAIDALQGHHGSDDRDSVPQKAFEQAMDAIGSIKAECFPSVGLGEDCRIREGRITGSALRYENVSIHAAVFWLEEERRQHDRHNGGERRPEERMASFDERRQRMNR